MVAPFPPPGMVPPPGPPGLPGVSGLPPELAALVATLPPAMQQQIAAAPPPMRLALLEQMLRSLPAPAGPPGAPPGLLGPDGMPLPPAPAPGNLPPVGAPPGIPIGAMPGPGMPPPTMPPPGMMGPMGPGGPPGLPPLPMGGPPPGAMPGPMGPPPEPPPPPAPPLVAGLDAQRALAAKSPAKRYAEVPEFALPDLPENPWGADGPGEAQVLADYDLARRLFRDRDDAYAEILDIYYLIDDTVKQDGKEVNEANGDVTVTRSQPATTANRTIGLTAPQQDRVTWHCKPYSDSPQCADDARMIANALHQWRDDDFARHYRMASNDGVIQPPLERLEAGLIVLEGTCPFWIDLDPANKRNPHVYEPVAPHEVYPLSHATLRIQCVPLDQARALSEAVRAAFPVDEATGTGYAGDTQVELVTWTDDLWWAMLCTVGDPAVRKEAQDRGKAASCWIQEPARHDLGFRKLQYGAPPLGTPLSPLRTSSGSRPQTALQHSKYATRGILHEYVGAYKFMNRIMSAYATELFTEVVGRHVITTPDPDNDDIPDIEYGPGGLTKKRPDQEIDTLPRDLAKSEVGRTFLQGLVDDLSSMAPPVIGGRGQAESGADRFAATQQAGALHVDPIIAMLQQHLQYLGTLRLEATLRKSKEEDGGWIGPLPVRTRLREEGSLAAPTMGVLDPAAIARNSTDCEVRFSRYSLPELLQLGALLSNLIKAKLMSRLTAMDKLDIEDPLRERLRIFVEEAMSDPEMVKTEITVALEEEAHPEWDEAQREQRRAAARHAAWQRSQVSQRQPVAPVGETSMPSMANMGGTPAPGAAMLPAGVMG